MTKTDIEKIFKWLEEKKDSLKAQEILEILKKSPEQNHESIIRKTINYKIIKKILSGELNAAG